MSQPINKTIQSQGSIVDSKVPEKAGRQDLSHTNSLKQSVLDNFQHLKYSHINYQPGIKIFFFEFIGMIIFLYGAICVKNLVWADVHVGLGVLMGVVLCGPISGANLNPMVTLCNILKKQDKFKLKMLPVYYSAQFLGAIIALLFSQLINDTDIMPLVPLQKTVVGCLQTIASEMIGTFILIFFILQISNPNTTFIDNELSGYMFIVLFVHTGRRYAPSSHQCINSMIAFSFALISAIEKGNFEGLMYCPLWFAGDLLGTLIATVFYEKLFEPNVYYMRNLRRDYQNQQIQSILQNHLSSQRIPTQVSQLNQN